MSATLLLESTKYQVFDLGYGIVLVDRNVEEINIPFSKEASSTTKDSKGHLSVFFKEMIILIFLMKLRTLIKIN